MGVPDGRVNAVEGADQHNYIYLGAAPYRLEPFPSAGSAEHRMAAHPALGVLESWRDDETPGLSVRLVPTQGRLAHDFVGRSAGAGWTVALARHRGEEASGADDSPTTPGPDLLLVVDHAPRWPLEDLITLARQQRDAAPGRLRLLLLSGRTGGWWQDLVHQFVKLDILNVDALWVRPTADGVAACPDADI